ncbi:hypothetical protein BCT35_11490 [Vibrio lentus]|uniref:DUF924 family protein n=1 Tax=Vibrio TaxID=662 RepID=UPI0003023B23|nr:MULTISPECIES: DUF924 family protein [Vibrio]OED65681.1 hypothetical protein A165_09495 [Vibrio tasmaniensis ZS-17]PMI42640.1 hypothetical protein BCU45_13965 [Vibrio lentus]PMI63526.1 hypothetical protein BCU40_20670 [Vibrio lentus]PMJ51704.1 hypothetical protein BCU20_07555 [Vibrio lentus]PML50496.1 hypothetical protein BCT75_15740 [Vibrio lentus]
MTVTYQDVLEFWFDELTPKDWFTGGEEIDALIESRFAEVHKAAAHGELFEWRQNAQGRLAEIIVLDQFSRNIGRSSPTAFSADPMALALAQEAVSGGFDHQLNEQQKSFLYMPYMHSESLLMHEQAVLLFSQTGLENNLDFEFKHKVIIERFGRYPHRNEVLGRASTPEEVEFLQQPGSSF